MQIPFFTIIFIIFLFVLSILFKKSYRDQEEIDRRFWNKERQANLTPKKDISNLDYIIIPEDLFPLNLGTDTEQTIASCLGKKMLNLTGLTNADVKLEYGMPNFEELAEYDDNFSQFIRLAPNYAKELMEADQEDAAVAILEFAVENHADSRTIYQLLAESYSAKNQPEKINHLLNLAKELNSLSKDWIVKDLNSYLPNLE